MATSKTQIMDELTLDTDTYSIVDTDNSFCNKVSNFMNNNKFIIIAVIVGLIAVGWYVYTSFISPKKKIEEEVDINIPELLEVDTDNMIKELDKQLKIHG